MRRTVFNEDHEAFRETIRAFIEAEVVPVYDEWFAALPGPARLLLQARRAGRLRHQRPRGVRRRRPGHPQVRGRPVRRDLPRGRELRRLRRARAARPPLHQDAGRRRAEEALPAEVRLRRGDVGPRDDRAGHRLRRRGHEDHRQALRGRHALRPQRLQDLHHRRRARRPCDRLRPHRRTARGRPPLRHLPVRRGHQVRGLLHRPQARQARPAHLRHGRAGLRRRQGPGRGPARRGGQGLLLPRPQPGLRALGHRVRCVRPGRRGRPVRPAVRHRPHRLRQAGRALPEHQVRAGRLPGRGGRGPGRRGPRPGGPGQPAS